MKAGVAAMIYAARVIAAEGLRAGRLIVAAVVDEEYGSLGADALVTRWRADAAVVTEPTGLQIAIGHKGFAWFEVETRGRAAHGSRPKDGRDAILYMGRVLAKLEALDRHLQAGRSHPLMGPASLHASLIDGGREVSSYPDRCRLTLERRTIPGETAERAAGELEHLLAALRAKDPDFQATLTPVFGRPPYEIAPDHELPRTLASALDGLVPETNHGRIEKRQPRADKSQPSEAGDPRSDKNRFMGMSFWTDASVLGAAGIPSVLFGPGGAGLHSIEEYVEIADVWRCRDALAALARAWCEERKGD
jgi:acetylornithine deacetylase